MASQLWSGPCFQCEWPLAEKRGSPEFREHNKYVPEVEISMWYVRFLFDLCR
jgi:hypothetical protein